MYGAYLRKSRADLELERNSGINTLKRHKDIIINTANSLNITINNWWQEVVSGDTIEDRPEVQKMLLEVEKGMYDGILVVDIDRLARGDTADQARISKCFLYSNTKIITPNKIYDPNNEDDEENRPYDAIVVARNYVSGTWGSGNQDITNTLTEFQNKNGNSNPCADYSETGQPTGWRLPNLVELSAMASNPDNLLNNRGNYNIPCCTMFSNQNVRQAFYYNRSNMVTCDRGYDQSFRVRCVRDATDEELAEN